MLWVAAAAEVSWPSADQLLYRQYGSEELSAVGAGGGDGGSVCRPATAGGAVTLFAVAVVQPAAVGVVQQLRTDVMDAALRQPLSEFDVQPVGQIISRVTNDTEVIRDLYVTVVATVLRSAALIGAMLVAMFSWTGAWRWWRWRSSRRY